MHKPDMWAKKFVGPGDAPANPLDVEKYINELRANNNLHTLRHDHDLAISALYKAHDMVRRDYFDHTSPDDESPHQLARRITNTKLRVGEVITEGANSYDCVTVWQTSPPHLHGLLDPQYTHIGVGMVLHEDRRVYWCVGHLGA